MPSSKQSLTASVDSLSFKEKEKSKRGGTKADTKPTEININPTHQFMEAIRASALSQTFQNEDFPIPPPNKYKYSKDELLGLYSEHPLRDGTLILPETTRQENLPPVCKDPMLLKDFQEALHGQGKWVALQSPVRTSTRATRGRGRSTKTRGRPDLMTSTDSSRRPPKGEKKLQRWGAASASEVDTEDPRSAATTTAPPPTAKSQTEASDASASGKSAGLVDPVDVQWQYINDQGKTEGPYKTSMMEHWYKKGYLPNTLPVRKTTDKEFVLLSSLEGRGGSPFQPHSVLQAAIPSSSSFSKKQSKTEPRPARDFANRPQASPIPMGRPAEEPARPQGGLASSGSGFNFASLIGLAPDQVQAADDAPTPFGGSLTASGHAIGWNGAPEPVPGKAWKLDQIEGQWGGGAPPAAASPWRSMSAASGDVPRPLTLAEIQEQQTKEPQAAGMMRSSGSAVQSPAPEAAPFAGWGFTSSQEAPVISQSPSLFSSGNSLRTSQSAQPAATPWGASGSLRSSGAGSFQDVQEEEARKAHAMRQHQQQQHQAAAEQQKKATAASLWGSVPASGSSASLHAIQKEEERNRQSEQQRMYEEHRRRQQEAAANDMPWSNSQGGSAQLSLKEIQDLQMEESRRQQERALRNAREMEEAQQSAMWGSMQGAQRPKSLLEIQEEERRRKEMQERAKAAQMQSRMTSNTMWGSAWGSGPASSFSQIQEQQAQAATSQPQEPQQPASSVADVWAGQPTAAQPKAQWGAANDDALLWDPTAIKSQPTAKPQEKNEFPSLGGPAKGNQPKQKKEQAKPQQAKPQQTKAAPAKQPEPKPAEEKKSKPQRKKKKGKKVDASEFFSFGPGSLAGRPIETPDY